eukprot:TRINITY_DN73115_c0_g1_i1.p1 TRINITY_DN73115_c0_g1~~TRINITY_DN73115_c0_g1_i1.p1  ORF type:complete len:416 (+),score=53.99 TRINITY_DN73115_c0_g1_i1:54-1301(+)
MPSEPADCVTPPLELIDTTAGRGYRATRNLPAGGIILRCAPIAATLHDKDVDSRCSRCLTSAALGDACQHCGVARFCSACVENGCALKEHRAECRSLSRLWHDASLRKRLGLTTRRGRAPRGEGGTATTMLRLAVKLLASRARCKRGEDPLLLLGDEDGGGGTWIPEAHENVVHDSWDDVEQLEPRDDDALDALLESLPHERVRELEGGSNAVGLLARAPREEIHKLLCRIACNAMALAPEKEVRRASSSSTSKRWEDFGVGLYPSGAMLNHSCAPNCLWFVRGGVLFVETTQAVRRGEELTIPYLPVARRCDAKAASRRKRLSKAFGFHCLCIRCTADDDNRDRNKAGRNSMKRPAAAMHSQVKSERASRMKHGAAQKQSKAMRRRKCEESRVKRLETDRRNVRRKPSAARGFT